MEFFQELTFTAFVGLVLSLIIALAVFNTRNNDGNPSVCSSNAVETAKEETLSKGLKVKSTKSRKRVKFVDDVVIRKFDHYEIPKGSQNIEILGDNVEGKIVDEKVVQRVDQFVANGLISGEDYGGSSSKESEGSENVEMLIKEKSVFEVKEESLVNDDGCLSSVVCENPKDGLVSKSGDMVIDQKEGNGGVFGVREEILETEKPVSHIAENPRSRVVLEITDTITDRKKGKELAGAAVPDEQLSSGVEDSEEKVRSDSGDVVNEEGELRVDNKSGDDDDWEGIERSELEKVFAEAVNYLEYGVMRKEKGDGQLAELSSDVQMQLYGLHKVAVEGPCHESQPMALKLAARAKWNSWQRLGSMSQEAAMEQYIKLLADSVPDWAHDHSAVDIVQILSQLKTETEGDSGSHKESVIEDKRMLQ